MNIATIAGLLRDRARLRTHDGWTRDEVLAYQARRLADLRAYATTHSPFYRDLHRGLEEAPLSALPVVTKATLMERFDDLVTDRDVRIADVERYVSTASATDRFLDRYRVVATGGTTGRRGVFLADPHEWTQVLASYGRAYEWAGVAAGLTNRIRMAVVSSRNPTHQSSIVGATVASRFIPTLRLDARSPWTSSMSSREPHLARPRWCVGPNSRRLHAEPMDHRGRQQPDSCCSAVRWRCARSLKPEVWAVDA